MAEILVRELSPSNSVFTFSLLFVIQSVVSSVALLVYSTAELISRFTADLQRGGQTLKMAAVLSLLPAQGPVKGALNSRVNAK